MLCLGLVRKRIVCFYGNRLFDTNTRELTLSLQTCTLSVELYELSWKSAREGPFTVKLKIESAQATRNTCDLHWQCSWCVGQATNILRRQSSSVVAWNNLQNHHLLWYRVESMETQKSCELTKTLRSGQILKECIKKSNDGKQEKGPKITQWDKMACKSRCSQELSTGLQINMQALESLAQDVSKN